MADHRVQFLNAFFIGGYLGAQIRDISVGIA
jgi:hypothetical protein